MSILEQIRELTKQLTQQERQTIMEELKIQVTPLTESEDSPESCPHCSSNNFIKHSKFHNRPRYMCKNCNRTFTMLTGTPIHGLKKQSLWIDYYKSMIEDGFLPLNKMKKKFGISIQTAFDWRHKTLSALEQSDKKFEGITEIDDIWKLYSQKGRKGLEFSRQRGGSKRQGDNNFQVKLLTTADRNGTLNMTMVRIGRLKKSDIQRTIGDRIIKGTILVSDKHKSISGFAKDSQIEHKRFTAKNHTLDNQYHVQYVNNVAARFDTTVNRVLRGVSTKYLQNYSNWFVALESIKKTKNNTENIRSQILKQCQVWNTFTNFERQYKKFINTYSVRTYRCPTKREWKSQNWNNDVNQPVVVL